MAIFTSPGGSRTRGTSAAANERAMNARVRAVTALTPGAKLIESTFLSSTRGDVFVCRTCGRAQPAYRADMPAGPLDCRPCATCSGRQS